MTSIGFTNHARRSFRKLDPRLRLRILMKLKWYASQNDPLHFADAISDTAGKLYRFRIGDYRVIFDFDDNKIIVTEVGLRSRIYRGR